MFNQRPTSLLGLESRHDGGELLSFLSPMITTPDEYIKYFDYFLARERLTDPSLPATTPNTQGPNLNINQFHQHQQQQIQHHHQQQQQQQQQHLAQQALPQQLISTSQQVDPLQYHQQSRLQHLPNQLVPPSQPHQPPLLPETQLAPSLAQNLEVNNDVKQELISLGPTQEVHRTQAQHFSQPQIIKESCQNQPSPTNNVLDRAKLSEEEKIRNKRERNRRAAANCRRRKDDKLRQLSEENMELRKTIDNLQSVIISLQARLAPGSGST